MQLRLLEELDVQGKIVLLRVDYNVPIHADGSVGDSLRIEASFPTIRYLQSQNARIVLISHLGRPEGKRASRYSLKPVAITAAKLLGHPVAFVNECIGAKPEKHIKSMQPGDIVLLENLRFHTEEEANTTAFAKQLSRLGELFVNDAFAVIHRAHASIVGVPKYLEGGVGFLVESEVDHVLGSIKKPERPLVAVIGGAKVSTKIEVLENLLSYVDILSIGGAMANTFLVATGHSVGASKFEHDYVEEAQRIISMAREKDIELILPTDLVVSKSATEPVDVRTTSDTAFESDDIAVDIGPETVSRMLGSEAPRTVIWNGPLGIDEVPAFAVASRALAKAIIDSKAKSIIGGGDTAAFIDDAELHDAFTWVSTGGGASLELMAGRELPGLKALEKTVEPLPLP